MTRVDDYLDLVDNPARQALTPGHPADDALLALLVHVAFSDGAVDAGELGFLERALPGRDPADLVAWVEQVARHPLDFAAVAAALPTSEERWKGLRFAARMAYKDGSVQATERQLLGEVARGLGLGPAAVEIVLSEVSGRGGGVVSQERIVAAVGSVSWNAVQVLDEPVSGLLAEAAGKVRPVRVVALDDVAVLALHERGIAAHFLEGTAFVPWGELVTYSRVGALGAAVQLHTEDGRTWTLVDARLRGLTLVLDRLFGAPRPGADGGGA